MTEWESHDRRTFLAKELLSQVVCSKKQKQNQKKEVLNKVNELLWDQHESEEMLLFLLLWQSKQKIADCLQVDRQTGRYKNTKQATSSKLSKEMFSK